MCIEFVLCARHCFVLYTLSRNGSSKFYDNPLNTYLPSPCVTEDETEAVGSHVTKVTELVSSDDKVESGKTGSD